MIGDKALRFKSIPYRANWFDNNAIGNVFKPAGTVGGDLSVIMTGNGLGGMVRFLRPFKGDIISAKLTMNATGPVLAPTLLRFYKGLFAADGFSKGSARTEAEIAADWLKLTGRTSALSYGSQPNIFIDGLNLMPLIPKRGDSDFNEDGFIIGIDLVNRDSADWYLYDFKIDCAVRIAQP